MTIPFSAYILLLVLFVGATVAMAAFVWAVKNKQFKELSAAATIIFDEEEQAGLTTDDVFNRSDSNGNSRSVG